MSKSSRSQRARILSATSALAIIAGMGGNAWACNPGGTITGPGSFGAFSNFGTLDCVSIKNHAVVHGNVHNGASGVIGPPGSPQPGSLSIDSSTISGAVQNSGHIFASGGTPAGINVTGSSVITNGIINNSTGTISVNGNGGNAVGINLSLSSFSGNITNNGVINASNASGSAVGIQVGGGGGVGPLLINPSTLNSPTTPGGSGGVTPLSTTSKHGHHH
jgi:hypothetical protein